MKSSDRHRAVAEMLRKKRPDFVRFVRARVPLEEADDIIQLASIRALEHADSLKDLERLNAWLYRIHRNVITDILRRRASEQRIMSKPTELPEKPTAEAVASCDCSVRQARTLNATYATILGLVDIKGKPLTEVARVLGITVNNATVRLHRARTALKKRMLEHCGVSSARDCMDCRCTYDGCCAV